MKKSILCLIAVAALSLGSCNSTETHDRSVDKPAGSTPGPESGEDARQNAGDEPNESGSQAADAHGESR